MCAQNLIFLSLSSLKMRGSQAGTDFHSINKYMSSGGILSRGIINPLSNAQKTGFSEKPVFYSCKKKRIVVSELLELCAPKI